MRTRRFTSLLGLLRDERGVSIVELALFTPVVAMIVMGMADLGRGYSERHDLQQAVNRTLEMAQAKMVTADSDATDVSYEFLRTEAAAASGVPLSNVTLTRWRECDGAARPWAGTCGSGEETARYIRIEVTAFFEPTFDLGPIAKGSAAVDGKIPMRARAAVRVQ